ncbi:MAG: tRNA (N(6)-L-threonylcarbamoyladenosine(37)-C(2))-methylthiotransferase [Thaumarchaeota archaeon]|nr:tRNA (N(6)-L-threonylcarbamoyladenosine(37)-C(2))-methylthiotransferase [Nitrososphaerota archaeon]MDE1817534.1 tRNA (N(6)-L-threonylcarbamoyladenosine(37)-C(2))-methylthiotransferase [Nitrososphaerota archaeon]MDE1876103.1 tRNA (N(6)-L-threonylcarbamoyladenosine(37)-C(2))-methylthiotransferase [Nitrososphaerota archaeon]
MAKIWVEAYGCSASFADSEMISGLIVNGGHTLAENEKDSDLSVIVTCSVKDVTAHKMVHRIKKLKTNPLVVAGCLPKAEQSTVEKFSPKASLLGPNSLGKTLDVISSTLNGIRKIELADTDVSKVGLPKVRLNPAVGIIEIASGCMSECTFCQTKIAKGDLQSYRVGDIVRQVQHEIKDGCVEVWLTSTDNGCYGFDIGSSLPELVQNVSSIEHDFMIRVGMMNPMYLPRIKGNLLKSFVNDRVFKFLHIPVQSGSDKVLKDMKRLHTSKIFYDVNSAFRERFDRFTIATDIIVGFPTETEEDFAKTVDLIDETRPDIVNLSRYSARSGTKAAQMDQNDVAEVKRRSKIVFDMAKKISQQRNEEWIGWKGEVLFDEISDGITKGRNFAYKQIVTDDKVKLGKKVIVKIDGAAPNGLYGTIVS